MTRRDGKAAAQRRRAARAPEDVTPAAMDAAAQLRRVLALIPRLADGEEHSLDAIGATVDADAETVLRDLESIAQRFDEPGGFVEGLQIMIGSDRVSVRTNHFLRPMRLTVPELHALDLGLTMLLAERPPDEARVIEGARARIRSLIVRFAAAPLPDSGIHVSTLPPGTGGQLALIRQSLRNHTKAAIRYRRADAEDATERIVRPYRLVFASGTWYLIAHCERSGATRVFRVDRIEQADALAESFDAPKEPEIARHVAQGRAFLSDTSVRLRVRYSPRIARWIAEREVGTHAPDGSFLVEHPLADADWAVRHVLQYGPDAEVIGPETARSAVRRRLETMLG